MLDIWLAASMFLLLLQQAFLWIFLRRKHVQMRHFYIGTPGYLEHKYIRWCREHERHYLTMIIVRVVLIVSIILALIATQISDGAVWTDWRRRSPSPHIILTKPRHWTCACCSRRAVRQTNEGLGLSTPAGRTHLGHAELDL